MKNTAAARETEAFYGTDNNSFYLDSTGQAWIIQSVDGGVHSLPCRTDGIPADAVELSDQVLDDQAHEDAETIEASYRWIVCTEAGDGLNNKTFDSLEEAKAAVEEGLRRWLLERGEYA